MQCCSSVAQSCLTLWPTWIAAHQASLSFTNSWSFLKLMSIESMMPSNHLIFCHPLLLLSSIFPSIRVFSNESALCTKWPECWSFSFSISPSNEYSALISFRIDWLDLFAVQGTLKSLLPAPAWKKFFSTQLSLWPNSHIQTYIRWGEIKTEVASGRRWEDGLGLIEKEHEGTFCGDSCAPYLYKGLDG